MRFPLFYKAFLRRYLPLSVQRFIDLDNVQRVPSVFAGPRDLRASEGVFCCPLKSEAGWFYCVVECQASNDQYMDYRTQEYKAHVFQYHRLSRYWMWCKR